MKKLILTTIFILIILTSCSSDDNINTIPKEIPARSTNYIQFTLNVHDWVNPEHSIETAKKTIEIHEKYNIPIDIYLTGTITEIYLEQAPELISMLKSSDVVTISYHFRAPMPAYTGFDYIGLDEMNDEELYETLLNYEEHKLDLETGEYDEDEKGGYQLVKDTIGYAPIAVGAPTNNPDVAKILYKIYKEKGAFLGIVHERVIEFGEKKNDLFLRPEDVEIKWYEENRRHMKEGLTAEELIKERTAGIPKEGSFINIKMHENNYYVQDTPFWPVYWTDSKKTTPLEPPYDLDAANGVITFRNEDYQDAMWEFYEDAVSYVADNPNKFTAISNADVKEMLE